MKVAIARNGVNVSGHFGHCEGFEFYHLEDGNIIKKEFFENPGHKPGFLPKYLSDNGASVVIVGGMGASAQSLFKNNRIDIIVGIEGKVEDTIKLFIEGELTSSNSVCSEHVHKGSCGEH